MDISYHSQLLARWLHITWLAVWSKKTAFSVVASFLLAEAIWWKFWGPDKALEQAMENLIPGFAGTVIVLFVITIAKYGEASNLVRNEINESRRMKALQESEADMIIFWLSGRLADKDIGVGQAYLFGSATHSNYQTTDVDVVVLFHPMNDNDYVRKERRLAPIAREFEKTFQKPLHFQRFLATEEDDFRDFISMQSEPRPILEQTTDE